MDLRPLEDVVGQRQRKRVSFSALMPWHVRNILLVSSLYDSFIFQEDGNLAEMLVSDYLELNLSYAPAIERVSTAEEAIRRVQENPPDLLVSMPRVGGMDVLEFSRQVKAIAPALPVVLLAYDTRELGLLLAREGESTAVDRIFVWQGDARLFLAMIKLIEDHNNAAHDAAAAGVKSILLIEDSVRFYSAYLPMLYTEIVKQTQALMAEGVNRMQQLIRMRARPKVLLATSFEEGAALLERYRDHILGAIVDARFPSGGRVDPEAGVRFVQRIKEADPTIPVLMQSSEPANEAAALRAGATFIDKGSEVLLHKLRHFLRTYLGFGDFVFRKPDGTLLTSAHDLRGLAERLRTIPDESLIHHAGRNDFSTWLMARTEFDLAKALRPRTCEEFGSAAALRSYLLQALETYRDQSQAGLVAEFSARTFDVGSGFTRLGSGSLGGKGRGLAFVNSLFNAYEIAGHVPGVRIFVPPTTVIATEVFDRFMEEARLSTLALQETEDARIREAFLAAPFPEEIRAALRALLTQVTYPLAVRSSSLLEDAPHQPFAGIYQTLMLPNRHTDLDVRLEELCRAIRLIYASTYSADSKSYIEATPNRLEEEKMAVVIQEVIGRRHGAYLYPDAAGVLRSFNYYPIDRMKAEEGIASVALGLGRTVVDGGRCVRFSPAAPGCLYQFSSTEDYLQNAQREFYALDLSRPAPGGAGDAPDSNLALLDLETAAAHEVLQAVGSVYSPENDIVYEGVHRPGIKLVTMAGFLSGAQFPLAETLRFLGEVGQAAFSGNVEIEFAIRLRPRAEGPHEFAFLQVRPLVLGSAAGDLRLSGIDPRRAICISGGALGHGRFAGIADLVYVRPEAFDRSRTREIAAEVGAVNARLRQADRPYILIGPGRWGSADPWLGIPVTWAQISHVRCIVEDELHDIRVVPSQGTHFFQNITSFGIGYFTLGSLDPRAHLDQAWLDAQVPVWESAHVRHLTFAQPLAVAVDGRQGLGVILKPGEASFTAGAG